VAKPHSERHPDDCCITLEKLSSRRGGTKILHHKGTKLTEKNNQSFFVSFVLWWLSLAAPLGCGQSRATDKQMEFLKAVSQTNPYFFCIGPMAFLIS
jgi:hypothetical protein